VVDGERPDERRLLAVDVNRLDTLKTRRPTES
jgi:hypothetical protein